MVVNTLVLSGAIPRAIHFAKLCFQNEAINRINLGAYGYLRCRSLSFFRCVTPIRLIASL